MILRLIGTFIDRPGPILEEEEGAKYLCKSDTYVNDTIFDTMKCGLNFPAVVGRLWGMKIDPATGNATLSTGKEVYLSHGIVGLDLSKAGLSFRLHDGYDGMISTVDDASFDPEYGENALTREEQKELADYMIAAWTAYRAEL